MKRILSGSPSIVLNKNGIDITQLKKNNLDVSDLIESLRGAGYFSLDAVDYALYEANGTFSALPKQDYEKLQSSLSVIIIDEGKFEEKNVLLSGKTREEFCRVLPHRARPSGSKFPVRKKSGPAASVPSACPLCLNICTV